MRNAMRWVLLMVIPASAHAIGTLFYSHEERNAHDGTMQAHTINGIVMRGKQRSVIWIDGRPVNQNDPRFPGLRVFEDHVLLDGVSIKVGESGSAVSKKPLRGEP